MPNKTEAAEFCQECARLLADYASSVREARIALEEAANPGEAGMVDDVGFTATDVKVEVNLAKLRQAERAYSQHRQEHHG